MTDIYLKKKKIKVKRAGRHFGFFKRAGRHEKGAGRRALQKKPRQNTVYSIGLVSFYVYGSFRVRSTNGLRVTPPISMKFGTLADNA